MRSLIAGASIARLIVCEGGVEQDTYIQVYVILYGTIWKKGKDTTKLRI
jgi:hypothetical protein